MAKRILLLDAYRIGKYELLALFRSLPDDVKIVAVRDATEYDYQHNSFELELTSDRWDDISSTHMNYYLDTGVSWSELTLEKSVGKSDNSSDAFSLKSEAKATRKQQDNFGCICSCWLEYTGERIHRQDCSLKSKKTSPPVAFF